ncbi:MAG: YqcC family protein [Pseudomonas sp.]|uniref:YqcC family protein n=1 Tax=Pseudomonas sp. TaxID=306 RepID=UPI0027342998|nr:YqcC family protein [Pseudomonas sp.]MDP3847291.1 YqcC family protein [Pseudomonas sp.]
MTVRLLLTQQLLLIEVELRQLDWWTVTSPTAAALASEQPFAVDSMAFEQWLQWLFLPRMQQLLESGAPLPGACGIAPMAEMVLAERADQARALLQLLGEFDRLIIGAA